MLRLIILFIAISLLLSSGHAFADAKNAEGGWVMGFSSREIELPEGSGYPLYIAGYRQGYEITGVHDLQRASAIWMDAGDGGILLIGIDCVGLSITTIGEIRSELGPWAAETGCVSINVYSTHTHAGADTLGLWGPVGVDGKNPEFMKNLKAAAVCAAKEAYENRRSGELYYSHKDTGDLQHDSRFPYIYDSHVHQLRFDADSGSGIRLIIYAAHAESMRGDNTLLSRDFPGVMCDIINDRTGDSVMFAGGAAGGLIMTRVLTNGKFDPVENVTATGRRLADIVLSISEEEQVATVLRHSAVSFDVPLDNTVYLLYKTLGILTNPSKTGSSGTGLVLTSELRMLQLGDIVIGLLPCEIFPELVYGGHLTPSKGDPQPLKEIASARGFDKLLIIGLANDEIGYVVPPSDFALNEKYPFIRPLDVTEGENHYEETNSTGIETAKCVADAFEAAADLLAAQDK